MAIGFRMYNEDDDDKTITNDGKATVYENLFTQNYYDEPEGEYLGQLSVGKVNVYEEKDQLNGLNEPWVRCDYGWIKKRYLR